MKRQRIDIKKIIKKKIESRHQKFSIIEKRGLKNGDDITLKNPNKKKRLHIEENYANKENVMNPRTMQRINPDNKKLAVGVDLSLSAECIANLPHESNYKKKEFVDYDVVICIPSFDRYKKIKRLLTQLYEQSTKYTFKIVLLNDGSKSNWYDVLSEKFPDIHYLKNDMPNGKVLHWYCYNQMWEYLKNVQCHAVLQMDDDFILCEGFLDTIVDTFFQKKNENDKIVAISPHKWSFKQHADFESWWNRKDFVDGIALLDDAVIKVMDYKMKPVNTEEVSKPGTPVRAWTQIGDAIKKMGGIIFRTEFSLVYHDGNDDSKLHGDIRKDGNKGVYTQKYIGNL